ncbi:glycosyltransferase [Specibacter sp. NPDC057265]|uniref:glycosyltransferase n=1 Tax=Specibacter sp. NPDC057265 TaxID=3346075 RepID=UPI003644CA97
MRIAVLAHLHHPIASPFAGGMESHTAHLVAGLVARGHEVTLFAKEGSAVDCNVVPVLEAGFVVRGYPDDKSRDKQHHLLDDAMRRAVQGVATGSFDAVVNNSLSPIPHREAMQLPTLHILHTPPLPRVIEVLEDPARAVDPLGRFATVSAANAQPWSEWLPDIAIIHNGIDLAQWGGQQEVLPGTAAWTGRITPEKGTHVAIAAARTVGLKLQLAGPIQDLEYFRTLIEPELDDDIRYLGHLNQQQLQSMIGSAEVFISAPLWEEPFGLTTLEAMACGTPVATLPSGAMAELVGVTGGVVARDKSSGALAQAASQAKDLDRAAVLERAGNFTHDAMIEGYELVLRSMMQQPLSFAVDNS